MAVMSLEKKLVKKFNERCPLCGEQEGIGILSGGNNKRFFCNNCCIEFSKKDDLYRATEVDQNGAEVHRYVLLPWND